MECSTCGKPHSPPLGRRCKKLIMACVPGSGFTDRTDEGYMRFLEQKFLESQKKETEEHGAADPVLTAILNRLERLESKEPHAGAVGGDTTDRPAHPSPSDLTSLSDSIHKLSLSVHAEASPQKIGTELRPEYYVHVVARGNTVKNMSMLSLRSEELLFGMLSVYDYLRSNGGDARGYFLHMMFVARHLMERNFTVSACAKYDKYIVDQVLAKKGTFSALDQIAAGLFLHGGAVVKNESFSNPRQFSMQSSRTQPQGRFSHLRDCNRENTPNFMPENWPQEICFLFNTKSCFGRCVKQHICGYCKLKHRLADCRFAVNQVQDQNRM